MARTSGATSPTTGDRRDARPDPVTRLSYPALEWSEYVEQAHVPAEQPAPAQDPRFSPAHAHPRRPRDPVQPSSQGPQPPRRLRRRPEQQPGVLSSSNRLTSPQHFREVVRRGRRRGGHLMVVHLWAATSALTELSEPRVGFVVSRAVGPAVTRNLVKRRLRHLSRERLALLPPGSMLVVRALP